MKGTEMKNKVLLTIIGVYSIIILGFHVDRWIKLQEPELLLLPALEIEGTITAWKASQAFMLGMKFKLLPSDVDGNDFIPWCKDNDVQYIFWGVRESNTRPRLRSGEWGNKVKVVWNKKGYGFIGEVQ